MKLKKLIITVLTAAFIAIGFFYIKGKRTVEEDFYRIEPFRQTMSITVSASGYVTPRNRLEVKPPLSGRIEEVLVREGDNVEAGEVVAWMSSSERAALLDAARARGEEELKKWMEVYRPTPVIAPLEGFVIKRNVEPGQSLGSQEPVIVMADELIVRAQIDETDLAEIQIGQNALIRLDSYPRNRINGIVEHISYESEVLSNVTVYNVDVRPLAGRSLMRSGMNAMVEAQIAKSENALLIPASAIEEREGREFVRVEASPGEIELRQIETGLSDGSNTEIVSGIDHEDIIVLSLQQRSERSGRFRGGLPGIN